MLWSARARAVCEPEGMEQRCPPLETTRGARRGDAIPERATHAMHLTHGSAQDHRPDLPPAVCALLVAQDGGVPMGSKRWDGKTSDRQRCQERAAARSATWARAQAPRYLVHSHIHFVSCNFCHKLQARWLFWLSAGTEEIILTKH